LRQVYKKNGNKKGFGLLKGIIGDWRNFFCDELKDILRQVMGGELIALDY